MSKKLFTKVVSLSLTAAMVLSMAPINAGAAKKTAKPKSMKAPKSSKIKVGQTKTIKVSRNSKKSTKDVKYVNFKPKSVKNIGIGVKTSDDAVVSVEKESNGKYTYTGVNKGTATLTITSRAKTSKGKKLKAKMEVTVINPFKVTQTGAYTFTMSTADKLEKIDKRDVKVMQEGSTIDNAVKSVKISADKLSVEVEMEIPFVDQKKYEVTFGKEKDSFVASVGAPAAINIKTQTAVVNKPTEIEYAVVDAKGMDVTKVIDESKITVDVTTKSGYYDKSSKKLTLWKIGDTAEAKVVYHTWVYDKTTGKENVIEAKGTVTCVDKSAITVTGLDKWTIAERVLSWETDEMKTTIPQGKSSNIWVRMKKSDGTTVNNKDNAADFSFEPITTSVLYVYSNGSVYATREGVEYAKVTYFDGTVKYQYTLPITVGAASKPTSIVLSQPYVTISHTATEPTVITMKVLDQYGEPLDKPVLKETKHLNGADVATIAAGNYSKDETMLKLKITGLSKEGTGVYKLTTTGDLNITLTVNARDVSSITANDYMLKAEVDEFDVTLRKDTKVADADKLVEGIKLDLYATKAGLIASKANDKMDLATAKFTINGIPVVPVTADGADKLVKVAGQSLVLKPLVKEGDNYISLLKAGIYTITVRFEESNKTYVSSASVVIKNETAKPEKDKSYKVEKISATNDMSYISVVSQAIVEAVKDGETPHTLATGNNDVLADNSFVLAIKDGKATKVPKDGNDKLDALKSQVFVDTTALPSFRLDDGDKTVWVLTDKLNQKVENKDSGVELTNLNKADADFGGTQNFKANIKLVSMKDKTGALTLKVYKKGDSSMADADFTLNGTGGISGALSTDNAEVNIAQKATTPAGVYVVKVTYALAGKDYTAEKEITINKVDFAAVTDIVAVADNTLDYTGGQTTDVALQGALVNPVVTVATPNTIKVDTNKAGNAKSNTITVTYDNGGKKLVFTLDKAAEVENDATATATGAVTITVSDDNHIAKTFTIKGKSAGTTLVPQDKKIAVTFAVIP